MSWRTRYRPPSKADYATLWIFLVVVVVVGLGLLLHKSTTVGVVERTWEYPTCIRQNCTPTLMVALEEGQEFNINRFPDFWENLEKGDRITVRSRGLSISLFGWHILKPWVLSVEKRE